VFRKTGSHFCAPGFKGWIGQVAEQHGQGMARRILSPRRIGLAGIALGAIVIALVAKAQDSSFPTLLRGVSTGNERESLPADANGAKARLDRLRPNKPRPQQQAPAVSRLPIPLLNGEATRKIEPNPLRRTNAPLLTPQPDPPKRRKTFDDPYAPTGIALGGLRLFPTLDLESGYDSNPNRSPGSGAGRGSFLIKPTAEVTAKSEWSRHAFEGSLRGSYSAFTSAHEADRPELEAKTSLRLDLNRSTTLTHELRLKLDTVQPESSTLGIATRERPLSAAYGTTLGIEHRINRLSLGLRGSVDRTSYEDATRTNGTILKLDDRNFNQYGIALRAGYELTPGIRPFIEARTDTRRYDRTVDYAGYERSSLGIGGRVGTTFEMTRTLTGEVSAGYETRRYDDGRLGNLRGFVGDAALIWSASPLTTVTLRGASSIEESVTAGSAGVQQRRLSLQLDHAFLRNLTFSALGAVTNRDSSGISLNETGYQGTLRLEYKFNRSLALRGSFTHERLKSSTPGADYTANVVLVGLRLQR
jgi:hypothetical protein